MTDDPSRLLGGAAAAVLIASLGRRRRALSPGGALAAVLVGTAVVAGAGWWSGIVVVAFFATSSALSHARATDQPAGDVAARGRERDAVQVLANGGVAAALAALIPFAPAAQSLLFAGCAGAVATATADTWATELGARSPTPPRLLIGGSPVAAGTSGGVTPLGTLAAVAGAGFIAVLVAGGAAAGWLPGAWAPTLAATALAGTTGSLADSLLGATVQAAYRCPACDRPTERRVHRCGSPTRLVRGHPAVTNDVVNAAATLLGAALAAGIALAA